MADEKSLGFFTSMGLAEEAIHASRELEGFRDWPDGFSVEPIVVDERRFLGGFDVEADRGLVPD